MKPGKLLSSFRLFAGVLLVACLLLPLYSHTAPDGTCVLTYSWMMIADDPAAIPLLGVAYLWPVLILLLLIGTPGTGRRRLAIILEPVLVLLTASLIVVIFNTAFNWQPLFPWWPAFGILVSADPAAGSWLGLSADLLFLLTWPGLLFSKRDAR